MPLVFKETPEVTLATNKFIRVPILLQYDDTPLIEVVSDQEAGYSTSIPIYHSDGTYLAKVVGSRMFATSEGEKAGLVLRHPQDMTVCELDGKTLFELHRTGRAAMKAQAELYSPDGAFVRCPENMLPLVLKGDQPLRLGGMMMDHNTFEGCRIGIWIRSNGRVAFGCS